MVLEFDADADDYDGDLSHKVKSEQVGIDVFSD